MRFASVGASNANSYASAAKAVVSDSEKVFRKQRETGPDYAGLSKVAMTAETAVKNAATSATAKVTQDAIKATASAKFGALRAERDIKYGDQANKARMAGILPAVGQIIGSAFKKDPKRPPPQLIVEPVKPVDVEYPTADRPTPPELPTFEDVGSTRSSTTQPKLTPQSYEGGEQLSQAQIKQLAIEEGWSPGDAHLMSAIAMAESSGNSKAHNPNRDTGDNSYGIMQINMIDGMGPERRSQFNINSNDQLFDPRTNMRAAKAIYDSQGLNAWGAYTNGSYKKFF